MSQSSPDGSATHEAGQRTKSSSQHWLVRVVKRSGLASEGSPPIEAGLPIDEAWEATGRAFGLDDDQLAEAVASYFRLEAADLSDVNSHSARLLPDAVMEKHLAYPVGESERHVYVAIADPTNVEAEREISFTSGRITVFRIAAPAAIKEAIEGAGPSSAVVEGFLASMELQAVDEDAVQVVEEIEKEQIGADEASAPPVVKLTSLIIRDGIEQGASDIHIEMGRKQGLVRYRVDGVLHDGMTLPVPVMQRLISRIKILGNLDISDRLRPQDGKAKVRLDDRAFDLRISTIPSAGGGEKCVIRILDTSGAPDLDDLGIQEYELKRLRRLLRHRDGVVVVTGPTGSGKTTTLYGVLKELADGKVNIMTVEDPVEYELASITQTQIHPKQGVTFATALRALLRQDPDVILVGEIRDEETAQVAFRAAMTGHLVLATVHANDAVGAVARLADLELDAATIGGTLRGTLAQRLLRKVCPACATPVGDSLTEEEESLAGRHGLEPTVRAVGCDKCAKTGYKGRIPVQEVLVADGRMQRAIEDEEDTQTLQRAAEKGGMRTMHQVALELVEDGVTTLQEVERVLGQALDAARDDEARTQPRLLVVEDDQGTRLMMRSLLEHHGHEVEEAESGEAAKELLAEDQDFSLVVLDLQLGGITGIDVLRWIRKTPQTRDLCVLVRTGSGSNELETELLEAGADDYVTKSVEPERLMARINAVLRRGGL